jgi:hypothetical protein
MSASVGTTLKSAEGHSGNPKGRPKGAKNEATIWRDVLCLAFLAPELPKAILEGRQPTELTAKRLISSALKIPLLWADQTAFASRAYLRA